MLKTLSNGRNYHQIELFPTEEQKALFNRYMEAYRFVYNHFLNKSVDDYQNNGISYKKDRILLQLEELLTRPNYQWLNEVDKKVLLSSIDDLDYGYLQFYRKGTGFPKQKTENDVKMFFVKSGISIEEGNLIIPMCNQGIKTDMSEAIVGKLISFKIKRLRSGKYVADVATAVDTVFKNKIKHLPPQRENSLNNENKLFKTITEPMLNGGEQLTRIQHTITHWYGDRCQSVTYDVPIQNVGDVKSENDIGVPF